MLRSPVWRLDLCLSGPRCFLPLVAAVTGAVALEYLRSRKGASADLALALLFYGGIAGGLVLVSRAPAGTASLNQYLFGSITTTTNSDLVSFAVLAVVVIGGTLAARPALFAVSNDEEFAIARGLPVRALNMALAIFVAVAVVLSMRIIGVLLVGALMVVPVATAQHLARSFRGTHFVAMAVGACTAVGGVVGSYYFDTPSGATIVLLAIGLFGTVMTASTVRS